MDNVLDVGKSLDDGVLMVSKGDSSDELLDKAMELIINLKRNLTSEEAAEIFENQIYTK